MYENCKEVDRVLLWANIRRKRSKELWLSSRGSNPENISKKVLSLEKNCLKILIFVIFRANKASEQAYKIKTFGNFSLILGQVAFKKSFSTFLK